MTPDSVLTLWLGTPDPPGNLSDELFARFWRKDEGFDALLRERFGALHEQASRGELDTWSATPRGRVALVILLDQLSRNLYRGSARSFAQDPRALAIALQGMEAGELEVLVPFHRYFLIMPLMHSEDLAMQERCVELFGDLARREADSGLRKRFDSAADFAARHRDIVKRFGRFPHRNALLGRQSTAEELSFLQQPGSSF
jgi:uncharacterized protein (DUF924 family)